MSEISKKEQLQYTFEEEIKKLNPEQKIAVENIEGTVVVIAGPGTGKTHILSARIGQILNQPDIDPENILCLTFTDSGVLAMRNRLMEFIGAAAHRVHIFTFHSFCNKVIQENLEIFGHHDLMPLSDLERIELIRELIDNLPYNHILTKGKSNVYYFESHLTNLFRQMKAEDWSPEILLDKIEKYIIELPDREDFRYKRNFRNFKKGDIRQAKLDDEIAKMSPLKAAIKLFPEYINLLKKYSRYDYEDMILWVLREFEKNEALLLRYQELYQYFLVDEYQDTNGSQNKILQKLIDFWDNPNIFIVGDDDQSIYEFQGARLKNLIDFYEKFIAGLKLVVLKKNYRSSQNILNVAGAVIKNNKKRIINELKDEGVTKDLISESDFAGSKILPKIYEYPLPIHETINIVNQIEGFQKKGFPLNEIAVIYAKHKQSNELIELLQKKGIPYKTKRRVNILNIPLIIELRSLLTYLNSENLRPYSGESILFRILHFGFFDINAHDIAKLTMYIAKLPWGEKLKWRDAIANKIILSKIGLNNPDAILRFSEIIEYLLSCVEDISLPAFVERIINRSGLLHYILKSDEKPWFLQIVNSFLDFVKKETERNPRITLKNFLTTLKNIDENRLSLEVNNSVVTDDGVNLITAHSAKGLEFQVVFLPGCTDSFWASQKRTGNFKFSLPDTITFSGEEDAIEARRRLFYVAMTRAKEELFISYPSQKEEGKGTQRIVFIDEIIEGTDLRIEPKVVSPDEILNIQTILLKEKAVFPVLLPDKATIDEILEDFSFSASSLSKFLRCPLSFYYENILKVPSVMSEAASYGTAVHNALELLFEDMLSHKRKLFPTVNAFVKYFEKEMMKLHGFFSEKEYQRRLKMGRDNLKRYFQDNIKTWHKKVKLELSIKNIEIEGVPINGKIDRVEFHDHQKIHIVDYKTGSHSQEKLRRPSKAKKNKYGGEYWRQLVFYKILFESYGRYPGHVKTAEISYVNPDKNDNFINKTITISGDDVSFVKNLVKETYVKIKNHEFYDGCGEDSCIWCNFVKNHLPVDSFTNLDVEGLDD